MSDKLKPCPFCGSSNVATEKSLDLAYCDNCCAESNDDVWNARPIEDALNKRIAEFSQAVGLITALKPTMVMDTEHPLDMVREVGEHVTAQVVALTAALREANEDAARLAHSNTWVQVDDDGISAACIHCGKHAKYERDVIHRPDCPITLHRARVGGAA